VTTSGAVNCGDVTFSVAGSLYQRNIRRWHVKKGVVLILHNSVFLFVPLHFKLCFTKPTCSSHVETASVLQLAERSFFSSKELQLNLQLQAILHTASFTATVLLSTYISIHFWDLYSYYQVLTIWETVLLEAVLPWQVLPLINIPLPKFSFLRGTWWPCI